MSNKKFLIIFIGLLTQQALCENTTSNKGWWSKKPETREDRIAILQNEQESFAKAEQDYEAKKQAMIVGCLVREIVQGEKDFGIKKYRAFAEDKEQCISCLKATHLFDRAYEALSPLVKEKMRVKEAYRESTAHKDYLNDINFDNVEKILVNYQEDVDRELYLDGFIDKDEYDHRLLRIERNKSL